MKAPDSAKRAQRRYRLSVPIAVVSAFLLLGLATVNDYGVMWDCWEMYTGDRTLAFYTSLDPDYLDFGKAMPMTLYDAPDHPDFYTITMGGARNPAVASPHHIWPVGPVTSSITKHVLSRWLSVLDPIEGHHASVVLWATLLLLAVFLFVRRIMGWPAAVSSLIILAVMPRFWAHAHFNLKDIPNATMFSVVIFTFILGTLRQNWKWLLLSACLWGVAMATKANACFLPVILIPWFTIYTAVRFRRERILPERPVIAALVSYPAVGLCMMTALWPYLVVQFPAHIQDYVTYLFNRGYSENTGWQLSPLIKLVVATPLPLLLLVLFGTGSLVDRCRRGGQKGAAAGCILLWQLVTLLRVSIPGASDFDGIRHWLEILPAMAIAGGIGVAWLFGALIRVCRSRISPKARLALKLSLPVLILVWSTPTIIWSIRNHPHQIAFFNSLAGGLKGARARGIEGAGDYWMISHRRGMDWCNANMKPGDLLLTGIASQTVFYTKDAWLQKDISVQAVEVKLPMQLVQMIRDHQGAVYLMYGIRETEYPEFTRSLDKVMTPIHVEQVDGVPVLKILELKDRDGNIGVPGSPP